MTVINRTKTKCYYLLLNGIDYELFFISNRKNDFNELLFRYHVYICGTVCILRNTLWISIETCVQCFGKIKHFKYFFLINGSILNTGVYLRYKLWNILVLLTYTEENSHSAFRK